MSLVLACAMVTGWVCPADGAGASVPFGAGVSSTELVVVLDPTQPAETVLQNLAEAGFTTAEPIVGLPPRYANLRKLMVSSADEATRQTLLAVEGVRGVRPVYRSEALEYPIYPTGQVIAKFLPGTPAWYVRDLAARHGGSVARQIAGLPQTYVFDVDERTQSVDGFVAAVGRDSAVVYCQPSIFFALVRYQSLPIEDPLYPFQWHLNNRGQLPGAIPGADIDVEAAWDVTMGSGAVVAVIDDSIQRDHEDLADNYLTGFDFVDQDPDPSPTYGPSDWIFDSVGDAHGTAVSGLICAAANGLGVRGVAPEAGLIGCKIPLGYLGAFVFASDLMIADAFLFAEQNGAMVINNSWGGPGGAILPVIPSTFLLPDVISEAIDEVATNGRSGRGVLIMFSSGNGSMLLSFGNMYAAMDNTMAIGATLRDDTVTCYSNFGPELSVVAPGGGFRLQKDQQWMRFYFPGFNFECFEADIATTDNMQAEGVDFFGTQSYGQVVRGYPINGYNPPLKFLNVGSDLFCPDPLLGFCAPLVPDPFAPEDFPDFNYTRRFNGTSAACPVATGVAALVFSVNPSLRAEEVRNILEHTADKSALVQETFDPVTGHNERYGHGRVNARRAVEAAAAGKTWPSPVRDVQNVSSKGIARVFWTNPENDVAGVLVVRSPMGELKWAPTDGVAYTVGQQVAPGVVVVSTTLAESYEETIPVSTSYDYGIFVRNAANYYSWGRRTSFTAQGATTPPLASLSASVTEGKAPLTVHFAGGAIDESGTGNLLYVWNFGDGTLETGAAVDHTYAEPGRYNVTLRVTNAQGQSAETMTRITVRSEFNVPPQVRIVANPTSGPAPLVVMFQADASDEDGQIVSYAWDFGDGVTATGNPVEHTFLTAGTYGVKLTVTDDGGATATESILITVTSAGSQSESQSEAPSGQPQPNENVLPLPFNCGLGVPVAVAGTLLGLFALACSRRRE